MGIALPGAGGATRQSMASGALVIDGSLKFDASKTTYLSRTFGTQGNKRCWTWSGWVKRDSNFGVSSTLWSCTGNNSVRFGTSNDIEYIFDGLYGLRTNQVFRDNGWYHILFNLDTTQATAADRVKLYINGEQVTSFASTGYGNQNDVEDYNTTVLHTISIKHDLSASTDFDGRISQLYWIDGQALGPDRFGYTDPLTNTWRPKIFERGTFEELDKFNTYTWGEAQNQLDYQGIKFPTAAGGTVAWKATGSSNTGLNLYTSTDSNNWTRRLTNQTVDSTNGLVYESTYQYVILVNGVDATWANQLQMFSDVNGAQIHYSNADWPGNGNPTMTWARGSYTDGTIASYNSFYLPLDGNSPIGEDKSGNGNNWTPVNFGGSNTIDKATGAKPILNTTAGVVARPGVFGSGENQTIAVTVSNPGSGNKYYFDGSLTPNLAFTRGSTITFNTGDSSGNGHPFKLSSTNASGSGGSEYTDGVAYYINGSVVSGSDYVTNYSAGAASGFRGIKWTVPHNQSTTYYYCTIHTGMGNNGALTSTIDETKADPYAWKCTLAIPFINDTKDYSGDINCTVSSKTTSSDNLTFSTPGDMFYGSPAKLLGNGSSNSRVLIASGAFGFGTGDFTIEFWGHFTATGDQGNRNARILTAQSESGEFVQILSASSTAKMQFDSNHIPNTEISNKTRHYVYQRTGTTCQLIVDGVLYDSDAQSRNFADVAYQIGRYDASNGGASLYMADFRVYTGVQKYPNSGLSIGDPVFIPASISPDILPDTPSGVSGGSKPTKITDGAVTFDGTGDYLSIADSADFSMGTDDFTIEMMINPTSSNHQKLLLAHTSGGDYGPFNLYTDSGQLRLYASSNGSSWISGLNPLVIGTPAQNKWSHVAVTRSGNTFRVFLDGVLSASATSSSSLMDSTGNLQIAARNGTDYWSGYVSNLRIVKGTALYTTDFTPPTRELTDVTNTKLLCCQSPTSATTAAVIPTGSITANGNAAATNFNPFTTDINAVRGQESGYATLNPLAAGSRVTLSNGNLDLASTAATGQAATMETYATFTATSGKFYAEVTNSSNRTIALGTGTYTGSKVEIYSGGVNNSIGGSASGSGASFGTSDLMAVAVDFTNKNVYFYKNNILIYSVTGYTVTKDLFFSDRVNGSGSAGTSSWNFGQKPFRFPPPDGFQPLNAASARPETVIARPHVYNGPLKYTGKPGGSQQDQNKIAFTPDLVWVKRRNAAEQNKIYDTVRGKTGSNFYHIESNNNTASAGETGAITEMLPGGFYATGGGHVNSDGEPFIAWMWRAGGGNTTGSSGNEFWKNGVQYASAAAANITQGTLLLSAASIGTKQGFSICQYTSPSSADGSTWGHGLSQAPDFIISRMLNSGGDWSTYNSGDPTKYMLLNSNAGGAGSSNWTVTDTTVTMGAGLWTSTSQPSIAYHWHNVPGLQKFGKYKCNGDGSGGGDENGPFVELGFKPAMILFKGSNYTSDWTWIDNERCTINYNDVALRANYHYAEIGNTRGGVGGSSQPANYAVDFLSNGFKIRASGGSLNSGTNEVVYAAWAEAPSFNLYGAQSNAK